MERTPRSLRRLPGRKSESSKSPPKPKPSASPSRKPATPKKLPKSASPARKPRSEEGKSPARKPRTEEGKSPARRSRSRSAGRKKPLSVVEEKKPSKSPSRTSNAKSATKSPPKSSSIATRVKESVEKITKSLSPEVESYIRHSVSRFEEIASDYRKSATPGPTAASLNVTTRKSLRLRTNASNNVESTEDVEYSEEKTVRNHVGSHQESKPGSEKTIIILKSILLVVLLSVLTLLTVAVHVLCTRDDCRIAVPTLQKFLNYNIYFDGYIWPAFSGSLILFFATTHFIQARIKKAPYISLLGIAWAVVALASLGVCHFYFHKLRYLKFLPFVTASLFHTLVLTAISANINSLLSVKFPSFIYRLSALISLISSVWIASAETSRTVPNLAVYLLAGIQAWTAVDSLVFEPLLNRSTPLFLTLLVIRPLVHTLLPIYISANNVKVHVGLLAVVGVLSLVGYLLTRYSLFVKGRALSDPYSYRKLGYGELREGPWDVVRHPDLTGRVFSELGLAVSVAPHPVSACFGTLALSSTLLEAWHLDREVAPSRKNRKSILPLVF